MYVNAVLTLFQHLLFVILAVLFPLQSYLGARQIRRRAAHLVIDKERLLRANVAMLWILAALAFAALRFRVPVLPPDTPAGVELLRHPLGWALLVLSAFLLGWTVLQVVPSPYEAFFRRTALSRMRDIAYLLPETAAERRLWMLVSVTAGICEEFIFRGFLIDYLGQPPYGLSPMAAVFASSLIFGLGHLYQGIVGVLLTGALGLMMAAAYFLSGNLLLPILIHVLIDLRILLLWPPRHDELDNSPSQV